VLYVWSYSVGEYLLSEGHPVCLALIFYCDGNDKQWTERAEVSPPCHSLQLHRITKVCV